MATGRVFEDRSGFRRRRPGDPGIAGVLVSNGCEVCRTDEDGRWSLPFRGERPFVIKPPHWSVPPDNGEAADVLGLDFPLRRDPEPAAFEALLFADMQPADAREFLYVREEVLATVRSERAAFALNHGDVMGDDLSLFPAYRALIAETGLSWHHCPGNHDMDVGAPDAPLAFATWRREIGRTHSAFRYAGATFIQLNSVDYLGGPEQCGDGRSYRGFLGAEQLAFVANLLRHVPCDDLIVVSMHIPLVCYSEGDSPRDTVADRSALLRLLSDRPHTVSFAGHTHTTEHHYLGAPDGFTGPQPHHHHILTAASGSWWSGAPDERGIPVSHSRDGSPKGCHVLSVEGYRYRTRFVPFGHAGRFGLRMVTGSPAPDMSRCDGLDAIAVRRREGPGLYVNVFDAGPRSRVSLEFKNGTLPLLDLVRTPATDPFIVEAFRRDRSLCKPWVAPTPSSHLWTASLPDGVAPGSYRATIHATGEYGDTLSRDVVLDVVA